MSLLLQLAEMRELTRMLLEQIKTTEARAIESEQEIGVLRERLRTLTDELAARHPGKVMRAPFAISFVNALGRMEERGVFAQVEDAIGAALAERIGRKCVRVVGSDGSTLLCFDETHNPVHGLVTVIREQQEEVARLRAELARRAA